MLRKNILLAAIAAGLIACGGKDSDSVDKSHETLSAVALHPDTVTNILFAHGYRDDKLVWNDFAHYMQDNYSDWSIHRTSVSPTASIEDRATELAVYISGLQYVDDDSMIVVGHSMGGLDLRYIITEAHNNESNPDNVFVRAAAKIHKMYTLASPHGGDQWGGAGSSAVSDLGIEQMRAFNNERPYVNHTLNGREIPLLAMRFHCGDSEISDDNGWIRPSGNTDGDGTVALARQMLFGAPFTKSVFHAKHTVSSSNTCMTDVVETELTETVLEGIVTNRQYYSDVLDIVFYENAGCDGDEDGFFSSTTESGTFKCNGDNCTNDEISSMKIYPGIASHTLIELFDDKEGSHLDDWTRIRISDGSLITEPFCITGLEHDTTTAEAAVGISVSHHYSNGLNGKVSRAELGSSSKSYDPYDLVFYSGDDCDDGIAGAFSSRDGRNEKCSADSDYCRNDEARSLKVYPTVESGTVVYLYNDPDGTKSHGYTKITLDNNFSEPYCISGFDHDIDSSNDDDTGITMDFHEHTNTCAFDCDVTGLVSRIHLY